MRPEIAGVAAAIGFGGPGAVFWMWVVAFFGAATAYVEAARDVLVKNGIVINGLPIVNNRPQPWGGPPPRHLDRYYAQRVIGGPGAFFLLADGLRDALDVRRSKD